MKQIIPVKQGDNITLTVNGLGSSGEGVGKYEGFTVFVKGALPEEEVRVTITLVKKSYAVGALEEIVKASAERVEPACPVYKECGGCQLQHLSYKGQLECKRQQVQDALTRIGHLNLEALPVLGAAEPWSYRNKMQFPAAADAEGVLQIGCYATATHSVVDTDACMISKEANNAIMKTVRTWMQHYNISAYDEKTGKGLVRHIMGRVGVHSGEVMAVIITSGYDIPHRGVLIEWLKRHVPGLVSVVQNINKKQTNVVMGSKTRVLYGPESIKDSLGSLSFHISAQAFFQVNSEQAEKVRQLVRNCDRHCWMIGSVSPAMHKYIYKPALWVVKHKFLRFFKKKKYSMYENKIVRDLRDGKVTKEELDACSTCEGCK